MHLASITYLRIRGGKSASSRFISERERERVRESVRERERKREGKERDIRRIHAEKSEY